MAAQGMTGGGVGNGPCGGGIKGNSMSSGDRMEASHETMELVSSQSLDRAMTVPTLKFPLGGKTPGTNSSLINQSQTYGPTFGESTGSAPVYEPLRNSTMPTSSPNASVQDHEWGWGEVFLIGILIAIVLKLFAGN